MGLRQSLEIVTLTDPGKVRSHNEDSVTADADAGFVILADGMGGYNAGEVASGIAVAMLAEGLRSAVNAGIWAQDVGLVLDAEIGKTNAAIYQAAQSQPQYAGMGTTLVTMLFLDNRVTVAHIGDSRLYRYRQAQFEQLTRDHSLLQEQIDSGMVSKEEARLSTNKNLVTRALGVDPTVEAEIHEYEVLPGDIYLLCSDGLNDMVGDEEIELTLSVLGANLELAALQLVQMANDNGGRDNVSVILVRILHGFPASRGVLARLVAWFKNRSGMR
jgi:PPM family protein phosphatase